MSRSNRYGSRARPAHEDILQQVQRIRQKQADAPKRLLQDAYARAIDALNALDLLDDIRQARFSPKLCCGPKAVSSLNPVSVGAVIWSRPAGYFGYKTLSLMGLWAHGDPYAPRIVVGVKRLPFAAPFYNPEPYFKLIQRDYDLYYQDDGAPPTDAGITFSAVYDPEQRLALREQVAQALGVAQV